MIKIILLVLISEIFTAAGQVLLKKSANAAGSSHNLRQLSGHARLLKEVASQPTLWFGFAAMAVGLIVWIIALAQGDLSLVYPLGSIQYIIILFSAHFFLGEKIDKMKLVGTFLVVAGIVLITVS